MNKEIKMLRRTLILATKELSKTWATSDKNSIKRQILIRRCELTLSKTKQ